MRASNAEREGRRKANLRPYMRIPIAIFSNRYIRARTERAIRECPSLQALDNAGTLRIIENELKLAGTARRSVPAAIAVLIIYTYAISRDNAKNFLTYTIINLGIVTATSAIEYLIINRSRRYQYERFAISRLFDTVFMLERNSPYWSDSSFRYFIATRLENVALNLERIPLALKRVSPSVRRQTFEVSQRKAQAVRNLELTIIMPEDFTRESLVDNLVSSLERLSEGRWYSLPEAEYIRAKTKARIIIEVSGAVLAIAAAGALVGLAPRIGQVATLFSSFLIATAIALLSMAGVPLNMIERYTQAGQAIIPKANERSAK